MNDFLGVLLLLITAVGLTVIILLLTVYLGPKRTNPVKELQFETGNRPSPGSARERFPVHFYLVAILFVVFDIEIAFLYPWAVNFRKLGLFGLVEMGVFILILTTGWYYILKRGVLKWR
ncbi:MAG: NADH-quinone oxidoreductase subunit A [Calditrichaeota bacterium]|nr:NADH-quinone oxidoreductase subunit A [Calditrichota bacterium]